MKTTKEKIAYLRGMVDTMTVNQDNAKDVIHAVIGVLEQLSDRVSELAEEQEDLNEYVQTLDADLSHLEDTLIDEDDEDEFDLFDDYDDGFDLDDDEHGCVEVCCSGCGHGVVFEADRLDDTEMQVSCPDCGQVVCSGFDDSSEDEAEEAPFEANAETDKEDK